MLKRFNVNDFDDIHAIMEKSFPRDERRNRNGQREIFNRNEYRVAGTERKGSCAGFLAFWDFGEFVYLEHFAVDEPYRNQGLGRDMLNEMTGAVGKPVVLEVEPPEDEMTSRRIAFYERNGFHLNGYEYVQLAYSKDSNPVPLKIMSYPSPLSETEFCKVRDTIYKEIFGI